MKQAFTLIELLVVIAIIGILSAVVLTSLNGARDKARAVALLQTLQQVEKAFQIQFAGEGYPVTPYLPVSPGALPTVQSFIDEGVLPQLEPLDGKLDFGGEALIYRNNGEEYLISNCGQPSTHNGVNLYIPDFRLNEPDLAEALEDLVDGDGGTRCGVIRPYGQSLYYNIQPNPVLFP